MIFDFSTFVRNRTYSNSKAEERMLLFKSATSMTSRYAAKLLLCAPAFEPLVGDNRTEFNLTATWPPECRSKTPYIRQVSDLGMDPENGREIENAGILRRKVRHIRCRCLSSNFPSLRGNGKTRARKDPLSV